MLTENKTLKLLLITSASQDRMRFLKKMLHPKEQKREDVVKERDAWREEQPEMDLPNTYWLDESGTNCDMTINAVNLIRGNK